MDTDQVSKLNPVLSAGFKVDPVNVILDSLQWNEQAFTDILIALSAEDQFHNLRFPFGYPVFGYKPVQQAVKGLGYLGIYVILIQEYIQKKDGNNMETE